MSCVRCGCQKQYKDAQGSHCSGHSFFHHRFSPFKQSFPLASWRIRSHPIAGALQLRHEDKHKKDWKLNKGAPVLFIRQKLDRKKYAGWRAVRFSY
jgi:hypothetical protein